MQKRQEHHAMPQEEKHVEERKASVETCVVVIGLATGRHNSRIEVGEFGK